MANIAVEFILAFIEPSLEVFSQRGRKTDFLAVWIARKNQLSNLIQFKLICINEQKVH